MCTPVYNISREFAPIPARNWFSRLCTTLLNTDTQTTDRATYVAIGRICAMHASIGATAAKSWRRPQAWWMPIPFFVLLGPFPVSRRCSNHVHPFPSLYSSLPLALSLHLAQRSGEALLALVSSENDSHVAVWSPMMSKVGRDASRG